jgi:hypothetical protein
MASHYFRSRVGNALRENAERLNYKNFLAFSGSRRHRKPFLRKQRLMTIDIEPAYSMKMNISACGFDGTGMRMRGEQDG